MDDAIRSIASRYPHLKLLLLFGSRARDDASATSDWDFGFIAADNFDFLPLLTDLVLHLKTDRVDLVDLERANGLLRFRAAKDGKVVYEHERGEYEKFWLQAVHFWCDAGPIIQREYEALLKGLG